MVCGEARLDLTRATLDTCAGSVRDPRTQSSKREAPEAL
jgi:hypothetical protein